MKEVKTQMGKRRLLRTWTATQFNQVHLLRLTATLIYASYQVRRPPVGSEAVLARIVLGHASRDPSPDLALYPRRVRTID